MTEQARTYRVREVHKPWGSEQVFAEIEGLYVGKVIRVSAGESLSLQYHHEKTETISVIGGVARIEFGAVGEPLESKEFRPGDTIHLPAGIVHRILAVEDLTFTEVSTAHRGWQNDVVRLDDRYGRSGTDAP